MYVNSTILYMSVLISINVRAGFTLHELASLSPEDGEIVLLTGYRALVESRKHSSDCDIGTLTAQTISEARIRDEQTISRLNTRIQYLETSIQARDKDLKEERLRADAILTEKDRQIIEKDRKIEEKDAMLTNHRIRQANSSCKGADFQKDVLTLLHSIGAEVVDKPAYHSGDHWVRVEGIQIMIEDKTGQNGCKTKEIEKAFSDFKHYPSCDALIYLNRDYPIPGYKDMEYKIVDNRPVCLIGEFDKKDREDILRMVVQAFVAIKPTLVEVVDDGDQLMEIKLKRIRSECEKLHKQNKIINESKTAFNKYIVDVTSGWNKFKTELEMLWKDSITRMKSIMSDSVDESDDEVHITEDKSRCDICLNKQGKGVKHHGGLCPKKAV